MILTCPSCATRYVVDPALFGEAPRLVRCARCGQEWQEAARPPDSSTDAATMASGAVPPLSPPPDQVKPLPKGSALPALLRGKIDAKRALRWGASLAAGILVGFLLLTFFARGVMMSWIPGMKSLYASVGALPESGHEGLVLQSVRSEQRLDRGATVLFIEGQIANASDGEKNVPSLNIAALGLNGKAVANFAATATPSRLKPGEVANFETIVAYPRDPVTEISITFAAED